jgi:VIT1/CCC1 family predicted Fe2+/Mn2+ transporter
VPSPNGRPCSGRPVAILWGRMPPKSKSDKLDRELGELLQELRVALPGVQVLFAFLLTVPFSQGFTRMSEFQRDLYFAILISTAITSVMFIAPSTYHRLRWRDYDKERLLVTSNHLTIAGAVFLALSIGGAVYLIGDFMFGAGVASIAAAGIGVLLAWFWFGLPLTRKVREQGSDRG